MSMPTGGLLLLGIILQSSPQVTQPLQDLNLPESHLPYFFSSHHALARACEQDDECPYKEYIGKKVCWGYEKNCKKKNRFLNPTCTIANTGWGKAHTIEETADLFWKEADYGYVWERLQEMTVMCKPQGEGDSSLSCVKHTRYCRATNIYMDFANLDSDNNSNRYRENLFNAGQIGGHCKLYPRRLSAEGDHKSALQSWYAELEMFSSLPFRPILDDKCDIVLDKPTYLMKLDAGVNMYHHFCDYINLYASQHINGSFSQDVNIIMWDTSGLGYGDIFSDTWKAFSDYPIIHLKEYDGKKLCLRDAVFPLLPRMQYGMYYNMPLVPGCSGTGLYKAFSEHVLHRLNITQQGPLDKVRVTLLSRSTKWRRILNEEELLSAMKSDTRLEVRRVDYNWKKMSFPEQLKVTQNSDLLIGMHGAGLTHSLFLPDWGVLFELYNCEDPRCYKDLARLRGVQYYTWEKQEKITQTEKGSHPSVGEHAKFVNYGFDPAEFMRIVQNAADYIQAHPQFVAKQNKMNGSGDHHTEL
ncbi:EGF domain-specific O-linked N-acetylglucosamine transferase-like [Branchiostoma floridae x Branchiostoma japonicum]